MSIRPDITVLVDCVKKEEEKSYLPALSFTIRAFWNFQIEHLS